MKKERKGKRDLILNTAFRLFVEKGYLDTKIIDIADEAGIGKGTVYEYFSSKEALFAELLSTHVIDHYTVLSRRLKSSDCSCENQLKQYILFERETAMRYGNGKNYIDRLSAEYGILQKPELKEIVDRLMEIRFNTVQSILSEGMEKGEFIHVNPIAAALSVMGAVSFFLSFKYGLLSNNKSDCNHIYNQNDGTWDENELFDLIFNGLLSRNTA